MPPELEAVQLGLERGRVHGHEHVGGVARRGDLVVGDVDLERGDAGEGAGRRPDLGREVRQRGEVVAEHGAALVKRSPVSCMPSPESPAKRMMTRSSRSAACVSAVRSAVSDTLAHPLVTVRRAVATDEAASTLSPPGSAPDERAQVIDAS